MRYPRTPAFLRRGSGVKVVERSSEPFTGRENSSSRIFNPSFFRFRHVEKSQKNKGGKVIELHILF